MTASSFVLFSTRTKEKLPAWCPEEPKANTMFRVAETPAGREPEGDVGGWGSWWHSSPTSIPPQPHFRLLLVSVVWKTLEADMRFSMYWPRTWFSDFNLRFSSFTASTLADRSAVTTKTNQTHIQEFHTKKIVNGVD